jgi:uncharacterized protein
MENILVVGANTRPIACSLKSAGYNVYSVDYFGCQDLKPCVTDSRSFLSQKPFNSCGIFSQKFDSDVLFEMASEFIELSDFIVYSSGVSPLKFPKHKIIGNIGVTNVENKYKLYKHLLKRFEGDFKLPETYLVSDLQDALETADASNAENFLLKPLEGSGGVGIQNLDTIDQNAEINKAILQEVVVGNDVSASVLSNGDEATTILTTHQIIGNKLLGQRERYGYCGNIAPYTENTSKNKSIKKSFKEVSEDVVRDLKLIGSNGVDMIIHDEDIYVIEVNPRFQGTFEVAEEVLGINMAEAHISACNGDLIELPVPQRFAVKMIVFAKYRSMVGNINIKGLNDIPCPNVIIEEGEPVATVLTSGNVLEDSIYSAKRVVNGVYESLTPV